MVSVLNVPCACVHLIPWNPVEDTIIGIQFLGKSNAVCFDDQCSWFATLLLFHFRNWDTSYEEFTMVKEVNDFLTVK